MVLIHISDVNQLITLREIVVFKGSTLSQIDAPVCDARFIFSFFNEQLSIILAFWEREILCFSVLKFLLIKNCSNSAGSGSLFSNR